MLNQEPMYLTKTSNRKIADLFQAKEGKSLLSGYTVHSGTMMNIYENGLVTDTNGTALFKVSSIQKVQHIDETLYLNTLNSVYQFSVAQEQYDELFSSCGKWNLIKCENFRF